MLDLYDEELPLLIDEIEKIQRRERALRMTELVRLASLMWDNKGTYKRAEFRRLEREIMESIK